MKGTIDRIEGDFAVVELCDESENIRFVHFFIKDFEEGVQEGDCVFFDETGWHIDIEETEKTKKEITKLMDELFED